MIWDALYVQFKVSSLYTIQVTLKSTKFKISNIKGVFRGGDRGLIPLDQSNLWFPGGFQARKISNLPPGQIFKYSLCNTKVKVSRVQFSLVYSLSPIEKKRREKLDYIFLFLVFILQGWYSSRKGYWGRNSWIRNERTKKRIDNFSIIF